ncbi:unnamed protein product [Lactuca virosa]|uniref:Uncharacterized protein n=1 Tax=Lactuca virosa TaxID=75947 RepID=A0AAU9P5S6_9ASTR|nr:unnamed protein product [Lactuca virosa]
MSGFTHKAGNRSNFPTSIQEIRSSITQICVLISNIRINPRNHGFFEESNFTKIQGVIEANDLQKEQGSSYLGIKVYCSNAKELEVLVIPLLMIYKQEGYSGKSSTVGYCGY